MTKHLPLALLMALLSASCVSKKIYNDLEQQYADLKKENRELAEAQENLTVEKNQLDNEHGQLKTQHDQLKAERDQLAQECEATRNNLRTLQQSYAALEKQSDAALQANMKRNRELLTELEAKEKAMAAEQERLNRLQADLRDRSQRVDELERAMAAQQESMNRLRETLQNALFAFEGKGLTVEQKNGKVYVSMENKLLFESGSWAVGSEGRKAVVEVGKVLAQNPEISVLIEGHTDNVPYKASGPIGSNWDLSTKRATAIVSILGENSEVRKENLTAAGRGEHAPLATNDTAEGRAKNRRIEIILTPKLDEISTLLKEI